MPDASADTTLRSGFARSMAGFPERPALFVDGRTHTYAELGAYASRIAATLAAHDHSSAEATAQTPLPPAEAEGVGPGAPNLTAVFGHRHLETFAGILGVLFRGHGYVPLNPIFPVDRTRAMLVRSGVRAMVVDESGLAQLDELLTGIEGSLLVLAPALDDVSALASRWPAHRFLGRGDLAAAPLAAPPSAAPEGIAYLLFTSGSTGQPKGVMVSHGNVHHFLGVMAERYGITETDRFSHTFDLTFDLSVFDLFLPWERGACVYCPTAGEKMLPGKYVTKHANKMSRY